MHIEIESAFTPQANPFNYLISGLINEGFAVKDQIFPESLTRELAAQAKKIPKTDFHRAGIGRMQDYQINPNVRADDIHWIDGENKVMADYLHRMEMLRLHLNQSLYLGLFNFESHFAHYAPGAYYKKHYDTFQGKSSRAISTILYLNQGWKTEDGGELLLYHKDTDELITKISPEFGRLVIFLSELFPHEVSTVRRDRWSLTGWFSVR